MRRVALIAGEGDLPGHLVRALRAGGTRSVVRHLVGHPPHGLLDSRPFGIEAFGGVLAEWREAGVTHVCLAGRVARPPIDPARIDEGDRNLGTAVVGAIGMGDDRALGVVIEIVEEAGFAVLGAQDIDGSLAEVPEVGRPSERDLEDIARGRAVVEAIGALDVGQGCVVTGGQVVAVEALPGTDWMLAGLASRASFARPSGGVLIKAPKPRQDRRVDLPTIGPETVRHAVAAGLAGIAVERGGVLVLDRDETARCAAAANVFLHAFAP